MVRSILFAFALLLAVPFAALAQETEEGPSPEDVEATRYIESVEKLIGKQGEGAARATATKLAEIFLNEKVTEGIKKPIPKWLGSMAANKNEMVAVAGIENLTKLGPEYASKVLMKVLLKSLKAKEPSVQKYSACLKSFKSMADTDAKIMKDLVKLLKNKDHDVVGKTAAALSGYNKAPGKIRKQLLEECIKQSEGVYNAAQNNDQNAKRKWNIVSSGIMSALNSLSRVKFKNPGEARSWYNDNKKNKAVWK